MKGTNICLTSSIYVYAFVIRQMSNRPLCIACCAECDTKSALTTCRHFFCSACVQKLIRNEKHFCPQCKQNCGVIRLGDPTFPAELRELIVGNPEAMLQRAMRVSEFQRKQQTDVTSRAKEIISHLQIALRDGSSRINKLKEEKHALQADNDSLRNKMKLNEKSNSERLNFLMEKICAYENEKRQRASSNSVPMRPSTEFHRSAGSSVQEAFQCDPLLSSGGRYNLRQTSDATLIKSRSPAFLDFTSSPCENTSFREPSFCRNRADRGEDDAFFRPTRSRCSERENQHYSAVNVTSTTFIDPIVRQSRSPSPLNKIEENYDKPFESSWQLPALLPNK
ncbi:60S ribosomal protein L35a-like protein [Perkinsela sp. CCAP 1560/4]|nr:60S ribosomal protein L35a-like protein [Perkinsela sp. CCAP 1560/4]|eukprot:KNH08445.1 60S ribosomal protein L35a-like protein [Perkinsela sp. CCAP 1560/4]